MQPASPQFPEWIYKLLTLLPQSLTPSYPLAVPHVAINSSQTLPSTELPVGKQWPYSEAPQQSADMNTLSRAATMQRSYSQPIVRSAIARAWPPPQNESGPYAQSAKLHSPMESPRLRGRQ